MSKLKQILSKGLEYTAALWTPIAIAYSWVHEAAKILDNEAGLDAHLVQHCFQALLTALVRANASKFTREYSLHIQLLPTIDLD